MIENLLTSLKTYLFKSPASYYQSPDEVKKVVPREPDKDGTPAIKTVIVTNVALTVSFLRPHWFLVAFIAVVLVETLILSLFLKNLRISLRISLIANVLSSILAIPFLSFPGLVTESGVHSLWLMPIVLMFSSFKPLDYIGPTAIPLTIYLFTVALVLSIMIELYYVLSDANKFKDVSLTRKEIIIRISIANVASYSSIIITMLLLGVLAGLNPAIEDPVKFFSEWLFIEMDPVSMDPVSHVVVGLFTGYSYILTPLVFILSSLLVVFLEVLAVFFGVVTLLRYFFGRKVRTHSQTN